jgi:hypothetical protein
MKSQWLASLSCLAMAVAGMVTLTSEAQAQRIGNPNPPGGSRIPVGPNPNSPPQPSVPRPAMTTVRCAGTVTVAEKNGRQRPVITWATNYFGDRYSPETRCQMVSSKLHNAVMANGGSFAGIRFESGVVNQDLVVCALGTGQSQCNSGNMLFTLKPENRPRVRQILEELTNFSTGASNAIVEDSGEGIKVDMSDLDRELETSDPAYAPESPSQPAPNEPMF